MKLVRKLIISAWLLATPVFSYAFPIASAGTEGLSVLVANTGRVVATYQGNSASYSNDLYLVTDDGIDGNDMLIFNNHTSAVGSTFDLGEFVAGTELVFRLHVNNTGYDFYTGHANRNPDDEKHARVDQNWIPGSALVSFEDLFHGSFEYNDLSFSFTNTITSVPAPASLALLGLGLAGLGLSRRRKS